MLKDLVESARTNLNQFFDTLNLKAVEELIELLRSCNGLIIVTGIGKSGLVAEKIALTLTSTGSRAFFLSPTNALHGDIGIVTKDDIFLMFSKSGESDELLNMVPAVRNKGAKLVAIVNDPNSRLAKACNHCFSIPMGKELCSFDMVPTTSAVTQLILGDIISVALMSHKKFSMSDFAVNHPAGKIGRRLTLRVKDLMLTGKDVPLCHPQDKLVDTLVELSNKRCGCVLISDKNTLKGIFTDGDLRRTLQTKGAQALESTMEQIMTHSPRFINPNDLASHALTSMEANQKCPITVMPVIDEDKQIVGLIKLHDILQTGI